MQAESRALWVNTDGLMVAWKGRMIPPSFSCELNVGEEEEIC